MITQIDVNNIEIELDLALKNDLMKNLSHDDLCKIKKGFDLYHTGSVNIQQFIVLMIDALYQQSSCANYQRQILTFVEIYLLIDLKGIGVIKFQHFTSYLIDRQANNSQNVQCLFTSSEHLNSLQLQAQKVFPLQKSTCLGLLSNNKRNLLLLEKKTYKTIENISLGSTIINNVIYLADYEVYCLATNDKYLNFYETTDNSLIRRFNVPDSLFFMLTHQSNTNTILITGSTNGHLYEWSLKKILNIMNKKDKETLKDEEIKKKLYPAHEQYRNYLRNSMINEQDDLTCFSLMDTLDILVTGSNDSKVRLYDIRESGLHLNKQLQGHYKGIKGISISIFYRVIVSCSFDFDLLVWNAYLEHPVARLQGHQAPMISVQCPHKYQIIISMDARSIMKIWNSENYQLVQNLIIFQNLPPNSSVNMIYSNTENYVIVYTKKLLFYEFVVNYNSKLTDDEDISAIKYSPKNLQIYIGSKKKLKVWCAVLGIQLKVYKQLLQNDIAILQIDARERRIFLGSIQGEIIAVDIFTGLIIGNYSSHNQQIAFLLYNNTHQLLISGGWDRKIKIHNDTHHLQNIQSRQNVLRSISNTSEKQLVGGDFSLEEMLIATYSKNNVCRLWDFQKCFLEAQFIMPAEITLVHFITPLPLLLLIDIKGSIFLSTTKYHPKQPFKMLTKWKNMYSIQKTSQITYATHQCTSESQNKEMQYSLILGDQYGYIRIIDITNFILEYDLKPVVKELVGNKKPYRIEDYSYLGVSQNSVNTHNFEHEQPQSIVPPPTIKQQIQIKAHSERVNYVILIKQSAKTLLLSAGSDKLVKLWNQNGQLQGILKQGLTVNQNWKFQINSHWRNKQVLAYAQIKRQLNATFENYLLRKRMSVIPFVQSEQFEEVTNNQIYKNLKQVEMYLQKGTKKNSSRLY